MGISDLNVKIVSTNSLTDDIEKKIDEARLLIDKINKPWKYSNNRRKYQGLPLRRGGKRKNESYSER